MNIFACQWTYSAASFLILSTVHYKGVLCMFTQFFIIEYGVCSFVV